MKPQATPRFASFFAVDLAAPLHAANVIQFAAPRFTVAENAGQTTVLGGNHRGGGEGENGDPAAMNLSRLDFKSARGLAHSKTWRTQLRPPPVAKRLGLR